jgi:hypothetical protein
LLNKEFVELLLKLSDESLDPSMKVLLKAWPEKPSAIQILEVLDRGVFGALTSDFVMNLLMVGYEEACRAEGVTHEDVVKLATWRKELLS